MAAKYFAKREHETVGDPFKRERNRFDNYLAALGHVPITDITAPKLTPLLLVRHGEPEAARWADIDFEAGEWRYIVSKNQHPTQRAASHSDY